jgi:hypothetical protein
VQRHDDLAALAAEEARSAEAFLNAPRMVAGESLRVMTADDLHILDGFDNCFVSGGNVVFEDVEMVLWMLNTENRPHEFFNGFRYWRFARRLLRKDMVATAHAIFDYMDWIFADSGHARKITTEGGAVDESPKIGVSFLASLIVSLSKGLGGLHPNDIRSMPLPQIFAYRKVIAAQAPGAGIELNPSDKLKADCLEAYNHYVASQNAA